MTNAKKKNNLKRRNCRKLYFTPVYAWIGATSKSLYVAYFQCSVTCGQGQRTREVHCRFNDGRTSNNCDEKTRPQSVMDCVLRACPAWRSESWSEVSTKRIF